MKLQISLIIILLIVTCSKSEKVTDIFDCTKAIAQTIQQVIATLNDIKALPQDIMKVIKDMMTLADDIKNLVNQCQDPFCINDAIKRCEVDHPAGCEYWGAIAYPDCKPGYTNAACCICEANCPPGFTDNGLYCLKPSAYGRGAGYPWKFGDKAFDLSAAYQRCVHDNPDLGCEQWGAIYYPKCKANFHNVACCVCSPDCPSGWTDIGISCQKPGTYGRGVGYPINPFCHNSDSSQYKAVTDGNCDQLLSIVQSELQLYVDNQSDNNYVVNNSPTLSEKMADYLQSCYNGN